MSVGELIRDAYGYRNRAHSEIVNAPDWIDKERYDVEARADYEFPISTAMGLPPAADAALRALLAERFSLKVRTELHRRRVYELVVHRADGRLGPNLVPAKADGARSSSASRCRRSSCCSRRSTGSRCAMRRRPWKSS